MNQELKKQLAAYNELAVFLQNSVRKGIIPKHHLEAANTIIEAEESGVLYALESLKQLPQNNPLHSIFALLSQQKEFIPSLLSTSPSAELTFKNYVNSNVNKMSYKLANSIVKGTSDIFFGVLFIYGKTGLGKTHLLSAIANAMNHIANRALLLNTMDLELELTKTKQSGTCVEAHHWILNHKAILIDDLQDAASNFELQKQLSTIIKGANARSIPVVICSSRGIDELSNMDTPLLELAASGVTAQLQLPHREQLFEIAKNAAERVSVQLPDDVAEYLADNIADNVRHLIAAVRQIIALSKQTDTPISIDVARAVAPTKHDLQSTTPLPDMSHEALAPPSTADEEPLQKASIFKEMLASAQNEEEQCLALQIAVSEKIKELRKRGDTEEVTRLKTALEHLRAGEIREALSCTSL